MTRYVPTPLDHSPAAVSLDMLCLDMPAMVRICACVLLLHCHQIIFIDINECAIGASGCSQLCNNTIGSYVCACNPGYQLSYDSLTCNGECGDSIEWCVAINFTSYNLTMQMSMSVLKMEDWAHVHRCVPTPLDHSPAAVSLDMLCLDMPAMVRADY